MPATLRPSARLGILAAGLVVLALVALAASALGLGDDRGSASTATEPSWRADSGVVMPSSEGGWGFDGSAGAPAGVAAVPPTAPMPAPGVDGKGELGAGYAGPDVASQNILGRTVIRSGSVELTVESVAEAFDRVRLIAEGAGGFVAASTFYGAGGGQSASLTLRVPAEQFGQVVANLREIAVRVDLAQTSSQDVTEEHTDLQATIRNLRAVEQQYLTLLGRTDNIGDILMVQDRLTSVRMQIDYAQGRLNLLDNLASLATLNVTLRAESAAMPETPAEGFGERIREAWESSLDAIMTVVTGVAVAVVWSWWLIPLVIVAAIVARRAYRRGSRDAVDTPPGQS